MLLSYVIHVYGEVLVSIWPLMLFTHAQNMTQVIDRLVSDALVVGQKLFILASPFPLSFFPIIRFTQLTVRMKVQNRAYDTY